MEYLPTNLPQYVKQISRTALGNSVVQSGHVLLFSEDGTTLTAKLPDGSFVPVGGGGGGATDFYKCASVGSGTWTGYKAIFDSVTNTYRFSSTVTSGLTWTVITPTVGKIYADGALIEAKLWSGIPENGLIRYAPMNTSAAEDELENALYVLGPPTFVSDSGILCAEMMDSLIGYQSPISGLTAYSLSIWMKRLQSGAALMTFSGGSYGYGGNELWIEYRDTGYISLGNGDAHNPVIIITPGTFSGWVNIVLVWTGSVFRLYVNGTQQGSDTQTEYSIGSPYPYINSLWRATSVKGAGKYAAFRLYDRVLNDAEIAALSAEFTPTQA